MEEDEKKKKEPPTLVGLQSGALDGLKAKQSQLVQIPPALRRVGVRQAVAVPCSRMEVQVEGRTVRDGGNAADPEKSEVYPLEQNAQGRGGGGHL
jgi:hypothetical protein